MNYLASPNFDAQTMMGTLPIQHYVSQALDDHIKGYLDHGISVKENDVIIDVGANIGVLGIRLSKSFKSISIYSFEQKINESIHASPHK